MLIMVFLSFIMSIFIATQDPIIQKFTIRIAGGYISSKTGSEVRIGRLYISPDFTIHIDQFSVKDLHDNEILNVEELRVRPVMEDIIHGDIHVDYVKLTDAKVNLITYEGEENMNFQFLIDAFASDKEKEDKEAVAILVDQIKLQNIDFLFWNQNKENPEKALNREMDYAHLVLDSIDLSADGLKIFGDSIVTTISHLSASEASGFALNHLESQVSVSPSGILLDDLNLVTRNSDIHTDLHMLYHGYSAFSDFIDSVTFDAKIYPTDILLSDLGPFAKVMYEMPDKMSLEGWMQGPVRSFSIDDLQFGFGNQTRFKGSIALQPLDLQNGRQTLNITRLDYSYYDLIGFYLPIPSKTIPIPAMLEPLNRGTVSGRFNGSLNQFNTQLSVTSDIGDLEATLQMHENNTHTRIFEGYIDAERLDVGLLANAQDVIGTVDLSADVIGRQTPDGGLDLDIDGSLANAFLLGNTIDEVFVNGNLYNNCFNGKISIDDDELDMDFKGRLDFSNPKALNGNFKAEITNADLYRLNLIKDDETAHLRASITANVNNLNDFNKAEGTLSVSNVTFVKDGEHYAMKHFDGSITNDNLFQKRINLDCDFFDFRMAGKMDFATLGITLKKHINSYVTIPQWADDLERFEESGKAAEQDFIVELNLKDPKPLTDLFIPSVNIAKNTSMSGTFTSRSRSLNLTLRSKCVNVNNIKINDIECKSVSSPRLCVTRMNVNQIILRDSTQKDSSVLSLDRFRVQALLQNDSIKTNISWDDFGLLDHNKAMINTNFVPSMTGGRFNISNANILLNDSVWTVNPDNFVAIDGDRIQISDLELLSRHQSLMVDGYAPMGRDDTLTVALNQFDISTLDFIFLGMGFDPDGFITGAAKVSNLKDDMTIFANLDIKDLGLNGETFGDAEIASRWNNDDNSIALTLGLIDQEKKVVNLDGSFYTERKDDNLDFKASIDGLRLAVLSPFLNSAVQRLQGTCDGTVTVKGSMNSPDIQGQVSIHDGGCKINYLNTFYTFSPTLTLTRDQITFSDLSLTDTLGNTAMVVGRILHDNLKDFYLDLKLLPNNFLAMATTAAQNSSFYGTAIANGIVAIQGPIDNLNLSIRARTRKGTAITLPLGGNSSVKKHEFITFVNHNDTVTEQAEETVLATKKKGTNLNIGLNLSVTDDAQVKIIMPNSLGSMEAKGNGNIKLGIDKGEMSLIGDYVISSGSLALNIQDVIRRNFTLEPGSSISWTGDPVNGTINATGVYQTKAALSSLGLVDSTSMGTSNVKVECLVHLQHRLLNPDITFGIRLPSASEDLKQVVFNVIDTTNQAEMLTQTVYLMMLNAFNYGNNNAEGYYGFVTNQLNDFISQFTKDIDINFNYKPGSEMSNEEMTVAMRKQLFDDRLTIETNFGVIIPTSAYASNSTNIVGDFNLDYKITKDGRLSAQIFNRSNYNTVYYQYTYYKMAPYTQGIGLSYSKSFDKLSDLFKKRQNAPVNSGPIIEGPRPTSQNKPKTASDEPAQ